jgi:hypothetical protein
MMTSGSKLGIAGEGQAFALAGGLNAVMRIPHPAEAEKRMFVRKRRGQSHSRFVQEIVHEGFALRLRQGVPIQTARLCEPAHVLFTVAGGRLPPRVAFGGEVREDALFALGRQLFHKLDFLFVG